MKIGLMTDSLGHLSLDKLLPALAEMGLECIEFGCGNWSTAPHVNLAELLNGAAARREFLAQVAHHGLEISALNCSGNQLHPGPQGAAHDGVVRKTFQLANLMGIDRVVMMSGLPAGGPGDQHPNWITTVWPPENLETLRWQWEEVAIPYWRQLSSYARNLGINWIAIENHGAQLVYNTETLLRLREAAGENIGANLDPSHTFWMGGDPLKALRDLGEAIFHVHIKDTRLETYNLAANTLIETKANDRVGERSWNYTTVGYGHSEQWWSEFVAGLRLVGYDDVLSIEHEDFLIDSLEGVSKSVALLHRVAMRRPPSYMDPKI
jgi:sugar phosphate isomerase/epimerase